MYEGTKRGTYMGLSLSHNPSMFAGTTEGHVMIIAPRGQYRLGERVLLSPYTHVDQGITVEILHKAHHHYRTVAGHTATTNRAHSHHCVRPKRRGAAL